MTLGEQRSTRTVYATTSATAERFAVFSADGSAVVDAFDPIAADHFDAIPRHQELTVQFRQRRQFRGR